MFYILELAILPTRGNISRREALIVRPKDLVRVETRIEFNGRSFDSLEIDLNHINKGERSKFTARDILFATQYLIHQRYYEVSAERMFGSEVCSYFVLEDFVRSKSYKLVFCICSDRPLTIGVLTYYRLKGKTS